MRKASVGARVIVDLDQDGMRSAKILGHGRDSCGVHTEVEYTDGTREKVHRARIMRDPRDESAMRARVAGKEAVARRTAWLLEIGPYRARCVYLRPVFEVQIRSNGTWCPLGRGSDPTELLERLLKTDTWKGLIAGVTDTIANGVKP